MCIDRDKLYKAILSTSIGDALGVPVEFKSRKELKYKPVLDMIGGGHHNQPLGTWSDDTSMSLCLIDALNKTSWEVTDDTLKITADNFVDWLYKGKFSVDGSIFDVGNTCRKAINYYIMCNDANNCGCTGEYSSGNGALMRIYPLIFVNNLSTEQILRVSRLTHNTPICDFASIYFITYCNKLMNYKDKYKAFNETVEIMKSLKFSSDVYKAFHNLMSDRISNMYESNIKSSGYVVSTLEAVMWCFLNTRNYKECLLKAVNLGDDTDTVTSIVAVLAYLYYGNQIPSNWIEKLRGKLILEKYAYNKE